MNIAILLCAGKGTRFGEDKILSSFGGKYLFEHALQTLLDHQKIDQILIIASQENKKSIQKKIVDSKVQIVLGGSSRFNSVCAAYNFLERKKDDILLIHNGANPFLSPEDINTALEKAKEKGASGAGRKETSTLRTQEKGILDRKKLWEMETPQALREDIFEQGRKSISEKNISHKDITDDLCIAEAAGITPHLFQTSWKNRKITTKEDLENLEKFLPKRSAIGIGEDSHRFDTEKKGLILGGILFPKEQKLKANSDGDALIHALCNAFCSALGQGSFSSFADPLCVQGKTNSREYLRHILKIFWKQGGNIEHISLSLEAKNPKIEPRREEMQELLAQECHIQSKQIGITATSGENLTAFGRGEGIRATAEILVSFWES